MANCDSAVAGFDTDIDVSGGKENGVLERERDCEAEHWSRDEFSAKESSLNGRNFLQGLFSSGGIIPERKKFFAGIIFRWEESSLSGRNSLQGLFSGEGIIPERKIFFAEIIFRRGNHP